MTVVWLEIGSHEDVSAVLPCSNYLFHELPNDIRKQAVAEMARVLRPGGLCILTDSVQLGDRDSMNASLGNFEDFNGKRKPGLPRLSPVRTPRCLSS